MIWGNNILRAIWQRSAAARNWRPQTLKLRTTQRQDLVEICRHLMEAINPAFFKNASSPIIIALEGTPVGGKTIFRDVAVLTLLGRKFRRTFDMHPDSAALWWNERSGQMLEVGFMNARQSGRYQSVAEFLNQRQQGGVTLICNGVDKNVGVEFSAKNPDVSIDLTTFLSGKWNRKLVITTHSERLLCSAKWQEGLKALAQRKDWKGCYIQDTAREPMECPERPPWLESSEKPLKKFPIRPQSAVKPG